MKNENLLDQFFLSDGAVVKDIISSADVNINDSVLEIGPGRGVLTKELCVKAKRVTAIEIDKNFRKDLEGISKNLEVIFGDALKILQTKKYPVKFNKIIGSLPSSIIEPLMHLLTKINFTAAVFLSPLKFAHKLINNSSFLAYFNVEIIKEVPRRSFSPIPKTNWALVKITWKPDALLVDDEERFLRQYVYEHKLAKKKNATREGLIKYYKAHKKLLTKNEARKIIATKNPPFFDNFRRVLN